ncbi:MAG: thiamine pyrophosphate-dependent enzyme [Planctomycetota bacterium]|jgi:2-oxoglutarate ferredoxin oxidoreductase subunit beta
MTDAVWGDYETAWCPGCGNFALLKAVKKALTDAGLAPEDVLFVSGIGQAAKAPHYINCNLFNGLHGRGLAVATGAKLANTTLRVIYESGDGCTYGEGGNHFIAALRRNVSVTALVHDNQIYGLTKGQASPTSGEGVVTKAQPEGVLSAPMNPLALAVSLGVSFVARGFVMETDHLAGIIGEALAVEGFALVDVLQPCVTFNKVNTFKWYKERCYRLGDDHDPADAVAAMRKAREWGERIPIGVLYRGTRPSFEGRHSALAAGPLAGRQTDTGKLARIVDHYA